MTEFSKVERQALPSAAGRMEVRQVNKLKGTLGRRRGAVREPPLVVGHPNPHPSGPGKPLEGLHSKSELCFFNIQTFLEDCI